MTSGGGNSSLVVPMVMWGPHAPTHCISAIYLMRDQKTLVTGASDGQVILWEVDPASTTTDSWNLTPRHLLMGHTAPIKCIAKATAGTEAHHVVTSSENGEMFSWDTIDGRCIENKKHPGLVHTSIQVSFVIVLTSERAPFDIVVKFTRPRLDRPVVIIYSFL